MMQSNLPISQKKTQRIRRLFSLVALSLLLTGSVMAAGSGASTPEIWFFLRPYAMMANGVDGRQGWQKLFLEPNAPWPSFMDDVQVVALSGNMKTVPDDVLATAFAKLKQKRIGFAIESLAQSWVGYEQYKCGHGIEGYTDPPGNAQIARRIKAAGGELVYVTMDEPLYNGHYHDGPNACHSTIENVAERAAAVMREYQKVFPNVMIGDTEPFPVLANQPNWQRDYREWMQAFSKAFGKPIAFLNMDIDWPRDHGHWQQSVREVADFARANHLAFGIVYNTAVPGGARSDEQWLTSAADNFTQIEKGLGIVPDKALFESWTPHPNRSITDANGTGEDDLVKRYLQLHGPK